MTDTKIQVKIIKSLTGEEYITETTLDEKVGDFIKTVIQVNDVNIRIELFKVVVGGQNINVECYKNKKMSFFLVEGSQFYSSSVINLVIWFPGGGTINVKYVIGCEVEHHFPDFDLSGKKLEFKDGVLFTPKSKVHQFRIVKGEHLYLKNIPTNNHFDLRKERKVKYSKRRGIKRGRDGDVDFHFDFNNNSSGFNFGGSNNNGGFNFGGSNNNGGFNFGGSNNNSGDVDLNDFGRNDINNSGFNFGGSNNNSGRSSESTRRDLCEHEDEDEWTFEAGDIENEDEEKDVIPKNRQKKIIEDGGVKKKKKKKVKFIDVESSTTSSFKFTKNTDVPSYRTADVGINFYAECQNESCDAHNQQIVIPMKYGDFDMLETECKCPACSEPVVPMNSIFVNCWWKFCGEKTNGSTVQKNWQYAGGTDKFSTFIHDKMDKKKEENYPDMKNIKEFCVGWKVLKFQVRDPKKMSTRDEIGDEKLNPDEAFCSICIDVVEKFGDLYKTLCDHNFHRDCIQEWAILKGKHVTCPMCRVELDYKNVKNLRSRYTKHYALFPSYVIDKEKYELRLHLCRLKKKCTIMCTGRKNYMKQDWFFCKTCDMTENHGVCEVCRDVCHKGHETYLSKHSPCPFVCCCGNGECEESCKCNDTTGKSDTSYIGTESLFSGQAIKMSSNEIVDDCVLAGCCTYSVTGRNFMTQKAWGCRTCSLIGNYCVCVVCKDRCHVGHDLYEKPNPQKIFCDCGAGLGVEKCKCDSRINKRKKGETEHLKIGDDENEGEGELESKRKKRKTNEPKQPIESESVGEQEQGEMDIDKEED